MSEEEGQLRLNIFEFKNIVDASMFFDIGHEN